MVNSSYISQLKWCYSLTKGYNVAFAIFYIAELLVIACTLLFIVFSKRAIDFAISKDDIEMYHALYWSVALIFSSIAFKYISSKSNELSKMRILRDLQNNVAKAQMHSSWEYVRNWSTGDILFRIQRDCTEVVQMIVQTLPNFTLTGIRLIASLSLLWVFDSRLALIVFAITPFFIFSKIFYKKYRSLNKKLKSTESTLSHVITENLKFRMLIKTLGVERQRWEKVSASQDDVLSLKTKLLNFSLVSQTVIKVVVNTGFLFTLIWGVFGLNAGTITFGMMTAFLQLVGRVQGPMIGLIGFFPSFVSFGVSVERVQEVLFGKEEEQMLQIKLANIDSVEICNVSFKYHENEVLRDINLHLKRGESVAVLGSSGRGKTTLIRLLLSVIKPQTGELKLHFNNKVVELDDRYKTNFGYVPQGDRLFSGTIRENLVFGDESISEEIIKSALYYSCAEFVFDLPEGLDTVIGESGLGLSEGQNQRIAIARTLIRDTPIWLFDEVTSSLDLATSKLLMERLKVLGRDKIFVFVTHDVHLAGLCDKTYYLN